LRRHETTAAYAQKNAPSPAVAQQIEQNVDNAQEAAYHAAAAAPHKVPGASAGLPSALDTLEQQSSAKTEAAVAEGKQDVHAAKAAGASYLEQVKEVATAAYNTAASYLPTTLTGAEQPTSSTPSTSTSGIASASGTASYVAQAAVTTATTAQQTLASTQIFLQPHIDAAKAAIQPHVDSLVSAAQPHVEKAASTAQSQLDTATAAIQPHLDKAKDHVNSQANGTPTASTGVPESMTPLDSQSHAVGTPDHSKASAAAECPGSGKD